MKRLSPTLSNWSENQFEDIYDKVKDYEDKVRLLEEDIINNNTEDKRSYLHSLNVEYIRFFKMEESTLIQKASFIGSRNGM